MTGIKKTKFTLTELILIIFVVAILGVLASFWISKERQKAKSTNCASSLKGIGFAIRMYSEDFNKEFPNKPGRAGFEMLRSGAYLDNGKMYTCPSTKDKIPDGCDLRSSPVSYMYASALNEATSVDSGLARDNNTNHSKYGHVLFVDGYVTGFAGANWTASQNYLGSSNFSY